LRLALEVELVGQALQEQHAEDEFLELRGIHLAAQDVGGLEQEGFELGEGDDQRFAPVGACDPGHERCVVAAPAEGLSGFPPSAWIGRS
jgi:hypothetical protein